MEGLGMVSEKFLNLFGGLTVDPPTSVISGDPAAIATRAAGVHAPGFSGSYDQYKEWVAKSRPGVMEGGRRRTRSIKKRRKSKSNTNAKKYSHRRT